MKILIWLEDIVLSLMNSAIEILAIFLVLPQLYCGLSSMPEKNEKKMSRHFSFQVKCFET
jgi:hypothetical protein